LWIVAGGLFEVDLGGGRLAQAQQGQAQVVLDGGVVRGKPGGVLQVGQGVVIALAGFWLQYLATSLASPLMSRPVASGKISGSCIKQRRIKHQAELIGHHPPNFPAIVACRRMKLDQRDTARNDGFVDVIDPVGGQEEQAVEILQHAQEDADDGIHRDVVVTLLDVDIGLVDQHHRPPALGAGQHLLERHLHRRTLSPSWPECTR
jgi:hypothetical protein